MDTWEFVELDGGDVVVVLEGMSVPARADIKSTITTYPLTIDTFPGSE